MMSGCGTTTPKVVIGKVKIPDIPDIHIRPIVPILSGRLGGGANVII